MDFKLTYGTGKLGFSIDKANLPGEHPFISPRKADKMFDIEGAIRTALEKPKGSRRLKDLVGGNRVALIVSDEFRSGQQEAIIKCLMEEIAEGAPAEVWTFCATGSHDPKIYAVHIGEWAEKYAKENGLAHRFLPNDCTMDNFVNVGTCSGGVPINVMSELFRCNVRVYGHESKHHYMNGYSCIDKQLLPGLCSSKTIELNHKKALNEKFSFGGRSVWAEKKERQTNPFSLGCFEAREIADSLLMNGNGKLTKEGVSTFGLDMISDKDFISWVAAGNIATISKEMTKEVDKLSLFELAPTRYVVISPGGPPASQTIYSTQNCFDMALSGAIEDGGEALIVAPCDGRPDVTEEVRGLAPDIKSKQLFYDNLVRLKDLPIEKAMRWIDENFELYLWKTDRVLKLMNRRKIKLFLHSTLPDNVVEKIGFIPVRDIQEWINERTKRNHSPIRVIDNGNKLLITN